MSDEQEQPPVNPPKLRATVKSCEKCETWVFEAVGTGIIKVSVAKEMLSAIRGMQAAIKLREGLGELNELRAMLKEARELNERQAEREVSDRYSQTSGISMIRKLSSALPT